jgi:hypothetical protein
MVNIFLEETTKPLTKRNRLRLLVMVFVLIPSLSYLYGIGERNKAHLAEIERINSQPVDVALPKELPDNIYNY